MGNNRDSIRLNDPGLSTKTLTAHPVAPAEALRYSRERKVELPDTYYGERIGTARQTSFSVAGLSNAAQIQGVLDSLNRAIETGETFAQWRKRVERGEVDLDLPAGRLETIFRTNIQSAYARGHYAQHSRYTSVRPFIMYDAINDTRTRQTHLAMDGYIAHYTDPIWATHLPPLGYNCRCSTVAMSEKEARRRGYGRQDAPDVETDPGWDYDKTDPDAGIERAIAKVRTPPVRAAVEAREERKPARRLNLDETLDAGRTALNDIELRARENNPDGLVRAANFTNAVIDTLSEARETGTRRAGFIAGSGQTKKLFRENVERWMPAQWMDRLETWHKAEGWQLRIDRRQARAWYSSAARRMQVRDRGSMIHEFAHHMQYVAPDVDDLFQTFHERRTAGEHLQRLSVLTGNRRYRANEVAKPDDYVEPYIGKEYPTTVPGSGRLGAMEVMTMAFQSLLGQDGYLNAMLERDRDLLSLALGVLFHHDL